MTKTLAAESAARPLSRAPAPPVCGWAALGVLAVYVQAWTYIRWGDRGGLHLRWERGAELPGLTAVTVRAAEVAVALAVMLGVWLAVREWRRRGRLGYDGAVLIGWFLAIWQTALRDPATSFNPYALHVDTWAPVIPGPPDSGSGGGMVPLLVPGGAGLPMLCLIVVTTHVATRTLARKHPTWGRGRRFLAAGAIAVVLQAALESLFIVAGTYAYSSYSEVGRSLSLWSGRWFQLALPEVLVVGLLVVAPLVVMRQTVQEGRTPYIFRGAEDIAGGGGTALRVLAVTGWINVAVLGWTVVVGVLSVGPSAVPDLPGYFV